MMQADSIAWSSLCSTRGYLISHPVNTEHDTRLQQARGHATPHTHTPPTQVTEIGAVKKKKKKARLKITRGAAATTVAQKTL